MMKRSLSKRELSLAVLIALLVMAAAYYFLVQRTVTNSMLDIESQRSLYESDIQIAQVKVQQMNEMEMELKVLEAQGSRATVPGYDNLSKELTFLNALLERTSNYTITFDGVMKSGSIARRSIGLSFDSGSYKECCNIIERLQNCSYLCRVGNIMMEPIQEYNTLYAAMYGYTFDADYSILRNPLQVEVAVTFFEKLPEEPVTAAAEAPVQ